MNEHLRPQPDESMSIADVTSLLEDVRKEHEHINERIDANGTRVDLISASLREMALRPPPELGKGIMAMITIALTVALASLAANLTTVILLVTHILGR